MLRAIIIAAAAAFTLTATAQQGGADTQGQGYQGPGSDLWIETRLITTYSLNEVLNPLDIGVDADNGRVTLTGRVDNEAEKELAGRIAEDLDAVTGVDNRLDIAATSEGARADSELFRFINDANVTTRVKMRLVWNQATPGMAIDVDTEGGVVTLSGTVDSEAQRSAAERIAQRTEGVDEIRNRIQVASAQASPGNPHNPGNPHGSGNPANPQESGKPGNPGNPDEGTHDQGGDGLPGELTDAVITTMVAASLRFDSTINHGGIDVSTEDGVVTLDGTVPYLLQKDDAGEIARETAGVKEVVNNIEVTEWK